MEQKTKAGRGSGVGVFPIFLCLLFPHVSWPPSAGHLCGRKRTSWGWKDKGVLAECRVLPSSDTFLLLSGSQILNCSPTPTEAHPKVH